LPKKFSISVLLLLLSFFSPAQGDPAEQKAESDQGNTSSYKIEERNGITGHPDWYIKPTLSAGFILEHRSSMGHLIKGYPNIYEVCVGKPTLGNKLWHRENNTPDIGFTFTLIDFKNPSQLGYAYCLAPFAEIPLNEKKKTSRVFMRLCWGLAYLNKCYDVRLDPKNIAIGSHLNSFVQFKWFWHFQLSKNLRFEPGFSFSHTSNARARVPNLGLNVICVNAGLNINIPGKQKANVHRIDSSAAMKSKNELLVYAAFGFNERQVAMPQLYCGLFSAQYHRNVRNTHKFGGGIDVFVDQNYLIDYNVDFNKNPQGLDNVRMAVKFCYSYNMGRISFPFETGYYFFQKTDPDGYIVSRIGVKYYTSSGLVFSVGLRTHFAVAYDFEYGVGYRLYLKRKSSPVSR
jgi:hypothetical protein